MIDQGLSNYDSVLHKKAEGRLTLTEESLNFHPTNGSSSVSSSSTSTVISWSHVVKHQVSPATYPKPLLKLVLQDGKSTTFQMSSRDDLERIRKDVTTRLQTFKSAHHNPTMRGNLKKRQHSDAFESSSSPKPEKISMGGGRTTATSFGELDKTALAVTRSSVLAGNPSLRAQHQYLVKETQTVTEEDFWETHNDLLEEEYARICGMTRAGTSSLLQSHLLLGKSMTLGVEEMRQIFIMYPAVHKAYEEKVPLELSDEQFWRKYLESEFFHRDRGRIGAASGKDGTKSGKSLSVEQQEARAAAIGTDDLFSRYDQKLRESTKSDDGSRKWGTHLAVGQFDLASTFETERSELLEGPKDNYPAGAGNSKGAKVIQKYNRHWAMVMHPEDAVAGSDLMQVARKSVNDVLPDDEDAKAGGGVDDDMRRLVGFAMSSSDQANHALGIGLADSDEYETLTLRNIEAYYSGRPQAAANGGNEQDIRKRNGCFANAVAAKVKDLAAAMDEAGNKTRASQLKEAFPPASLGRELLSALTKKMNEDSKTDADALEVVNSLPEDFKKRLHSYFRRCSELLRHFFGLRKLAEAAQNNSYKQKQEKIFTGMQTAYEELNSMREKIDVKGEIGEIMRKMCLQIMHQLDWVIKLHREGSGGGGGGGFVTIEEF